VSRFAVALLASLVACLFFAGSAGARINEGPFFSPVKPVEGGGTASSEVEGVSHDYAFLETRFRPSHIQPGSPFTYKAHLQVYQQHWLRHDCQNGSSEQLFNYNTLFMWQVLPMTTMWDDLYLGNIQHPEFPIYNEPGALDYVDTWNYQYSCAGGSGPTDQETTQDMTVHVPGAETQTLKRGCYQSSATDANIWFGFAGPGTDPVLGTLDTLSVGHVSGCAHKMSPPPPALTCKVGTVKKIPGVCEIQALCKQPDYCRYDTVSTPDNGTTSVKGKSSAPSNTGASKLVTFATGPVSLVPGEVKKVNLKVTKWGRRLIRLAVTGKNRAREFRARMEFNRDPSSVTSTKIKLK